MTHPLNFSGYIVTGSDGHTNPQSWLSNNIVTIFLKINKEHEIQDFQRTIRSLPCKTTITYENESQTPTTKEIFQVNDVDYSEEAPRKNYRIPITLQKDEGGFKIFIKKQNVDASEAKNAIQKMYRADFFYFLDQTKRLIYIAFIITLISLLAITRFYFPNMKNSLTSLMGALKQT